VAVFVPDGYDAYLDTGEPVHALPVPLGTEGWLFVFVQTSRWQADLELVRVRLAGWVPLGDGTGVLGFRRTRPFRSVPTGMN
jgi:hypothetical protein